MAGSPALAMGPELEQALEGLGVGRLRDGRDVGAWWLTLDTAGPAPNGRSGDLAIAAAILLRWCQDELAVARQNTAELGDVRPHIVITGSGRFALNDQHVGTPVLAPVEGWPDKLRHLAQAPVLQDATRVLLFCPGSQQAEVDAAARDAFACPSGPLRTPAGAPIEILALRVPGDLLAALRARLGRDQLSGPPAWQSVFPTPAPSAADLLQAAEAQAQLDGLGYLGVEHCMRAVLAGSGPLVTRLKRAISERDLFPALARPTEPPRHLKVTPRLARCAAELEPGFTADDLVRTLLSDRLCPLHRMAQLDLSLLLPGREDGDATMSLRTWGIEEHPPATALEVQCGPEDGRLLIPKPGDSIGRWAPDGSAAIALFQDTAARDRLFSRLHLIWEGNGRVKALRPCRLIRGTSPLAVGKGQVVMILEGDVLQASPATWLRGV